MEQPFLLTGKRIMIVGASSGIGRETALVCASLGAELILTARREDALRETLGLLEGENHALYPADVSRTETLDALFRTVCGERGALDGLVYCAGTGRAVPLSACKPAVLEETFRVNCFGFVECVRQACRRGRFREGMRIVGVSSAAAVRGDKARLAYAGSKAAMDASVRCMAKELAGRGICVNTVCPGVTDTDFYRRFTDPYGEDSPGNRQLLERQYLGVARPSDVASMIAFLLSPASGFITGASIPVDGGLTTS